MDNVVTVFYVFFSGFGFAFVSFSASLVFFGFGFVLVPGMFVLFRVWLGLVELVSFLFVGLR